MPIGGAFAEKIVAIVLSHVYIHPLVSRQRSQWALVWERSGCSTARSALLVTDWFHTRRALACFQKEAPGIHWMSAPVERTEPLSDLIWDHNGVAVAEEYLKLAYYAVRYGVAPFPRIGEMQG